MGERLQPTIDNAEIEREKYARKGWSMRVVGVLMADCTYVSCSAVWTGYALNIAIGLQVFLGAMTTALAAALTTGKQACLFRMLFRMMRCTKLAEKKGTNINLDSGFVQSGSDAFHELIFVVFRRPFHVGRLLHGPGPRFWRARVVRYASQGSRTVLARM